MNLRRRCVARAYLLALTLALAACGDSLTDAQRIWCAERDDPIAFAKAGAGQISMTENADPVIDAAKDLGILPTGLDLAYGQIGDTPLWTPLPGVTPGPEGGYALDEVTINPAIVEKVEGELARWRSTGDYARACRAAYELDAHG